VGTGTADRSYTPEDLETRFAAAASGGDERALRRLYYAMAQEVHPDKKRAAGPALFQMLREVYERHMRTLRLGAEEDEPAVPSGRLSEQEYFFSRKVPSKLRLGTDDANPCNGRYHFRRSVGSVLAPKCAMLAGAASTRATPTRLEIAYWDTSKKQSVYYPATVRELTPGDRQVFEREMKRFARFADRAGREQVATHIVVMDDGDFLVTRFTASVPKMVDEDGDEHAWHPLPGNVLPLRASSGGFGDGQPLDGCEDL
jgi:hypothetical protein